MIGQSEVGATVGQIYLYLICQSLETLTYLTGKLNETLCFWMIVMKNSAKTQVQNFTRMYVHTIEILVLERVCLRWSRKRFGQKQLL
jgi:hypothetical protein